MQLMFFSNTVNFLDLLSMHGGGGGDVLKDLPTLMYV
jgi:hypothetical protein